MSDARAKAEARRAKILAREKHMKVNALGTDDISLPIASKQISIKDNDDASIAGDSLSQPSSSSKERPLAARRNLIKSVSSFDNKNLVESIDNNGNLKTEVMEEQQSTPNLNDPDVESIENFEKIKNGLATAYNNASITTTTTTPSQKVQFPPKKSFKEIELEVAQNTATFDQKTLTTEKKPKITSTLKNKDENKIRNKLPSNIQPSNVMRLIRLFVIIGLGLYKGYYAIQSNNTMISQIKIQQQLQEKSIQIDNTFDDIQFTSTTTTTETLLNNKAVNNNNKNSNSTSDRTWFQWLFQKLSSPFESTITAVGMAWWISSILENSISNQFKVTTPQSKGILERLLSLYNNGFEGILERIFCSIGEYGTHTSTILVVATLLTLFSNEILPDTSLLINQYTSSSTTSMMIENAMLSIQNNLKEL